MNNPVRLLLGVLSLLLIISQVRAVSRLRLSAVRIGLSPASRGLATGESYLLRDTVQYILEDLLLRNSPNKQTPSTWPDITSIGLERILENSVSSDGILKLSVDGLVYFSFSGDKSVPTNDDFSKYLQEEILTPGVLLEAITTTTTTTSTNSDFPFQNFTRVGLWEDFFEIPTSAPTTSPTLTNTMQPTSAPTLRALSTPTAQINTFAGDDESDDRESTIIGAAIAGGITLFLTLIVCLCHKRNKPLQKVSEGSTTPQPYVKGNPMSTDKTLRSDEESNVQESKEGDLQSQQNSLGIADVTLDIDDMSDESFGDETFDDDTGFPDAERIQPDIVAPKRQDSFQHRVYSIQKDMMESSAISKAATAKQPKSLLGLPPSPAVDGHCVLEPTDVSAASLAEAGTFFRESSRLSDIEQPSLLVPKPIQNMWGKDRKIAELSSVDGDSVYSGWDPDDASTIESEDNIFLTSTIPNPAEQSLLHHSVRFESYKMQRLRTPESKKKTSHF